MPFNVTNTVGLTASVGVDLDLRWTTPTARSRSIHTGTCKTSATRIPAGKLSLFATASLTSGSLTADLGILHGTLTPNGVNWLSAHVTIANLGNPAGVRKSGAARKSI